MVNDLASFVLYDVFAPNSECTGQLSSALVGYGSDLDNDCENGIGYLYEFVATYQHYFNTHIIRYFHVTSLTNALINGEDQVALDLLGGMTERIEKDMADPDGQTLHDSWDSDLASIMLAAATGGFPLTSDEARYIIAEYDTAMDHYYTWDYWDLWDPSVPDGQVPYRPSSQMTSEKDVVRWSEMSYLIEFCYSPFRNDTSVDPSLWGVKK